MNALDTHGEDGLGESFLPEVTGYQQQISAVDFLADVLKKEKVSIIELAPMTNLARLIQKDKRSIFPVLRKLFPWAAALKVMETVHLLQNTITGVTRTALPWCMRHPSEWSENPYGGTRCDEKDCAHA